MDATLQNAASAAGNAPKSAAEERREAILRAAYEVFAQYGFKRTSMDDIAKAAGVSRPALYQIFANKREIFRGIITAHIDHVCGELETLLARDDLALDAMIREILSTALIEPHRLLEDMPHGEELLGTSKDIAGDLFEDWESRKEAACGRALRKHMGSGAHAENLARVIGFAISGMKARNLSADEMEREAEAVIGVVRANGL